MQLIKRYVDDDMIQRVAAEHRKGRRLSDRDDQPRCAAFRNLGHGRDRRERFAATPQHCSGRCWLLPPRFRACFRPG